ncbi:MAG TPA: hypothetical protein VGC13_17900 [Longimicrobium sp.]|jgi:hypothetical protein|uniref:hypothetical protein n=1 Tax=Longimicrobium sp. TaxID=2029185 RepID=UPI002ED88A8D
MRLMHSTRLAALLAPLVAAVPLAAQQPGAPASVRMRGPGNGNTIVVWPRHVQSLAARLDSFAVALPAAEGALWQGVLLRAAHAPTPAAAEVRVTPVLEIGPGGGCGDPPGMDDAASRVANIVQGGRTAGASGIIVQGGRTASPATGIIVQGGTQSEAGARTRVGTRPGAQAPRPTPTDAVAIGPKQDDPAPPPQSLGRRLAEFSARLPAEERGALDWLLTRAATAPEGRPGTPGGLPPGPCNPETGCRAGGPALSVSLRQALGIDALAIGPKQDDPAPPPPTQRWILRF